MAKINHFLTEHILVTSFSNAFVVRSRVRYIAVTGVLVRLRGCTGTSEHSLFANAISIIIPCADSNNAHVS